MPLQKLQFRPGINREGTNYSNEGGWFDGDKIRFRDGYVERIGGWEKVNATEQIDGRVSKLYDFVTLDDINYMFIGSSSKVYLEEGSELTDITPVRRTATVAFTTTNGSTTVTVVDNNSGASVGDYVYFESVSGLTGTNVATYIENDGNPHYITKLNGTASYNIELSTAADGTNLNAGTGTGNYYLESGIGTAVIGPGWGAGTWGRSTWGSGISQVAGQGIRLWSVDNFGEDLLVNLYDEGLYYYDSSGAAGTRLVDLSTQGGGFSSDVPTVSRFVVTSDIDRHCLAFGCNALGQTAQDKLLIRWADQEDPYNWTPSASNTAGDLRLSQGTEITAVVQTRKEILIWTDRSLHTMQFTGPPYTFGQALIADNIRIGGPNAAIAVNDLVYWMGSENFYRYDGRVQLLPCTVREYVFGDINRSQNSKIYAATITQQNEVWWLYCSAESTENDRYVVFNYADNVWYYGTLERTAMIDASSTVRIYPQATAVDGYLYDHEKGLDDGSTSPATAINAYIESSDFDLGEGDRFMLTNRIIPDITFAGSSSTSPSVDFSIKVKNYPGGSYSEDISGTTTRTATTPVEQYTPQVFLRARGRAAAIKVDSSGSGVSWRLGAPRIDIRQDGRR